MKNDSVSFGWRYTSRAAHAGVRQLPAIDSSSAAPVALVTIEEDALDDAAPPSADALAEAEAPSCVDAHAASRDATKQDSRGRADNVGRAMGSAPRKGATG
ncbi:hypothetical protein LYSHEL_12590 [Lysobacter helvus]|uniref:Uncharacterized protein n=2 Tax=Lysobacteraceae TaxID=32033 RepID=A0ABN6FTG1_9GAMM|nr:hypothetical protein LYSCAS_12590 [Lysobacter caseinilyticus]BCT95388.1 hypothetical protein LYSHEL_12590 [Lysobacter helvus]